MSKILTIFLCFCLLISLLLKYPNPAFADQSDKVKVTQNPNPVSISDSQMTITVESKDESDFFLEPKYSFIVGKGDKFNRSGDCNIVNFDQYIYPIFGKLDKVSASKVVASWNIENSPCGTTANAGDTWNFRLWAGDGWNAMNNNSIIVDYQFSFTQQGGTIVTITAKNPEVYAGQKPIVILSNAIPGADYTFWWDGDSGIPPSPGIAAYYSTDKDPANPLEVKIQKFNFNQPTRKLCMEYGNFRLPPGFNNCNPYVTFNFKGGQPPPPVSGNPKCTILPSAYLPIKSDVNIKIENLTSGTRVGVYVLDKDGAYLKASAGTSDSTNSVVINLLQQSDAGSYSVGTFYGNNPNQKVCDPNPTFIVGSDPVKPLPQACTNPDSCSFGGGKKVGDCSDNPDGPNPGIATAIGCIHTNPTELVKDLMKFAVGIGGGLAFLMMLLGAFQMLTSAGNPETLNAGKDRLTSAMIGLLFVIFAVLLLQIIGVDILQIPGFIK